jgi:hypothetical protein
MKLLKKKFTNMFYLTLFVGINVTCVLPPPKSNEHVVDSFPSSKFSIQI